MCVCVCVCVYVCVIKPAKHYLTNVNKPHDKTQSLTHVHEAIPQVCDSGMYM